MSRVDELKKQLGDAYVFQSFDLPQQMQEPPLLCTERTLAILTAGCLQIRAMEFLLSEGSYLGYDVFVKEALDATEWICYDTPADTVSVCESNMLAVLDRVVLQNGLSYTDCRFERLMGKVL